jgi:predicted nucleic acid-binding Zn ribbon protein
MRNGADWQRVCTTRRLIRGEERPRRRRAVMDLIWIIVIVLVVLALLGYFGRGRFR